MSHCVRRSGSHWLILAVRTVLPMMRPRTLDWPPAAKGLIRRIQPARSPAQYEIRVDDNHHHLVCRSGGLTVDVGCAVGSTPCLEVADDRGFIVDEAEVIYWGTCPTCQHAARPPRAANDTP